MAWVPFCAQMDVLSRSVVTFPGHTSTDKLIRDTISDADTRMSKFGVEEASRKDVYKDKRASVEGGVGNLLRMHC